MVHNVSAAPAAIPDARRLLDVGEGAPTFCAPVLDDNPQFRFDRAAGPLILMLFGGSGGWGPASDAIALVARHAHLFDDKQASFFGVTVDPNDAAQGRIARRLPGIRWFLDYDMAISRLYGAVQGESDTANYRPYWLLLDTTMRMVMRAPIDQGERIFIVLAAMAAAGAEQSSAPVLMVPRVFEPELCRRLIRLYEEHGGVDSGLASTRDGKTVTTINHTYKSRSDCPIADERLQLVLLDRMRRRLIPQIERAFQYRPTRVERWMVGCYDAAEKGFFRAHRDNTTAGTAHRAFACTINLNAEEFEGGELCFPEYGQRTYRAPTGGAIIFSCSLLHEAQPVTRGKRYTCLPFLYNEERARLREANQVHIAGGGIYQAYPIGGSTEAAQEDASQS